MGDIFKSPKMYLFVISELVITNIIMVLDDFPNMLRWQILAQYQNSSTASTDSLAHLLSHINKPSFTFLPILLLLHLNPFLQLLRKHLEWHQTKVVAH